MTKLQISDRLSLPLDWMTLATVVYGARGSGKTTLGSVIAEEVTKAKQRFCAIDLKGDWYGLKSTADGKGEGIPVVVFGGDHADVPLEEGAGAFIGETIAQLEQPAILDLEHLSKGKQVRFLAAFFERLYDRNRDPLLLLLDEAQRYAPQKPFDPDAAKCLGAVEDLVKLGRKHGIGPMLFTQRGSGLNKEVSELCDMLVAFRTPGPLDQDRVKGWLEANVTREQQQAVMSSLSGLATGTAVFASGHPDLKIFGTYAVRRRETFDSSATPKVGQRRKEPKQLAKPDLEDLRQRMADAIERQKADDPKALRALLKERDVRIHELERKHTAEISRATQASPKVERVEVPVLKNGTTKALTKAATQMVRASELIAHSIGKLQDVSDTLKAASAPIALELLRIQTTPTGAPAGVAHASAVAPVRAGYGGAGSTSLGSSAPERGGSARVSVRHSAPDGRPARTTEGISPRQQRFLDAAATLTTLGVEVTRETVAGWVGVHPRGGSVGEELKALADAGLVTLDRGAIAVTDPGHAAAGYMPASEAIERAVRGLSPRQARIFAIVRDAHPASVSREAIAEQMGIHPRGGSFGEDLGRLRGRGLIEYARGAARARDFLFAGSGR